MDGIGMEYRPYYGTGMEDTLMLLSQALVLMRRRNL